MVYLNGVNSIIESIYLHEGISGKSGNCNIFVNPENVKYIANKTVIINTYEYPNNLLETLINNGCQVISRIFLENKDVEVRPYILKVCFEVMWNGRIINTEINNLDTLIDDDLCNYDINNNTLYFPKLKNTKIRVLDDFGNITSLGWVLQQVGVNVLSNSCFVDLDVIKTCKTKW